MNSSDSLPAKKPFNVALFGASLDVGNMGVRALAASVIQLVCDVRPEARIHLLYGNRTGGETEIELAGRTIKIEIVNFRLSPKARLREHLGYIFLMACISRILPVRAWRDRIINSVPFLKAIYEADFVGDIRGGDSFSDIYGTRLFIVNAMPAIISILLHKKLVLLPQTYGPYKSSLARTIARFILARSSRIYARDTQSIPIVNDLLGVQGNREEIQFCPDVAFTLAAISPREILIDPPLEKKNSEPLVGLNISGLLYMGGFTRDNMFGLKFDYKSFVRQLLLRFLEESSARILIVPHVLGADAESEPEACEEVWRNVPERYRDRVHLLRGHYDQNGIKGIIGQCDFFLGARMHACIAALSQMIPTVGLAYSQKFLGVFESAGAGNMVLDCRKIGMTELLAECLRRFEERESVRPFIMEAIPKAQALVRGSFIRELSDGRTPLPLPGRSSEGVGAGSCC